MATVYLPLICKEDFDAFRRGIDAYFPNTYDEWADLIANRQLQLVKSGMRVISIEIHPDEFLSVWTAGHRDNRTFDGLFRLAALKGPTQHDD